MKIWLQESGRYIIEHGRGQSGCTVTEMVTAMQSMPSGFIVAGMVNRDDGTTVITLKSQHRQPIKLAVNKGD